MSYQVKLKIYFRLTRHNNRPDNFKQRVTGNKTESKEQFYLLFTNNRRFIVVFINIIVIIFLIRSKSVVDSVIRNEVGFF